MIVDFCSLILPMKKLLHCTQNYNAWFLHFGGWSEIFKLPLKWLCARYGHVKVNFKYYKITWQNQFYIHTYTTLVKPISSHVIEIISQWLGQVFRTFSEPHAWQAKWCNLTEEKKEKPWILLLIQQSFFPVLFSPINKKNLCWNKSNALMNTVSRLSSLSI